MKNNALMFLTLMSVWVLLNASLDPTLLAIGAGVSLLISFAFCSKCDVISGINLSPKAIAYSFMFVFVFIGELIKANISISKRVLAPSLPINPGIVQVKTKLKSKVGRMVLANAITLTPGTFTLDIKGEDLFIHWVDVKSTDVDGATKEIVSTFEKYLEVMYG
ncbi:MAG: Na+/H+ antiporter subunit E [Ichthyobacteriaceae bacterium]|nr:Na+/H+ antiporter subunit E [Ichthyobacteriaceae bacterium]